MWRDKFLVSALPPLQAMKTASQLQCKPIPYVYEQFNITFAYVNQTSYVRSIAAWILNALIQTFNRKNKLPMYIIMIPDKDIWDNIGYFQEGTSLIIKKVLGWLAREINGTINGRINNLSAKNPGAVRSSPYIIWVQMFARHGTDCVSNHIYSHKRQFNDILLSMISKYRDHRTIEITSLEQQHFDGHGELTALGYEKFWKEVDFRIKQFDRGDIDLKPDCFTSKGKFVGRANFK